MSIWYCKIGTLHEIDLPNGADWPMRKAIRQAFAGLTGQDDEFCFSGWSAELTECELAVVENREPVRELVANESPEMLRAALTAERGRANRAEADAVEAWRQVHLFKAEAGGPDGFATWKDAAIDERLRRVKAETERADLRERVARLVGAMERYFEAKQYAMSYASLPDARDDIAEAFEQAELLMSDALEGK